MPGNSDWDSAALTFSEIYYIGLRQFALSRLHCLLRSGIPGGEAPTPFPSSQIGQAPKPTSPCCALRAIMPVKCWPGAQRLQANWMKLFLVRRRKRTKDFHRTSLRLSASPRIYASCRPIRKRERKSDEELLISRRCALGIPERPTMSALSLPGGAIDEAGFRRWPLRVGQAAETGAAPGSSALLEIKRKIRRKSLSMTIITDGKEFLFPGSNGRQRKNKTSHK